MKNFRSSKNLKPVDPQVKQQSQLRMKIRILQQQIAMLQKSNLNIFIPLSQHPMHETVDYQAIINKLRQQIMSLQQQNQNQKTNIKKLQRQKQQMKNKFSKQIQEMQTKYAELQKQKIEIVQELQQIKQKLQEKQKVCEDLQKKVIEQNIQLKFLHEDLHQQKVKRQYIQKQLKDLRLKVSEVLYSSRIYKSLEIKCICLEKSQYDGLKAKIAQLQAKILSMIQASRRQKITLGTRKDDIGQQIVRLKKNIDLQLGIQGNSRHSQEFLKIYRGTNDLFNDLIKKCQA